MGSKKHKMKDGGERKKERKKRHIKERGRNSDYRRRLGTKILCYISVGFLMLCLPEPHAAPLPVFHHNTAV
jgi:hypothetical protein